MTAEIYYFTGTGNSLALARQLSRRFDDARLIALKERRGREGGLIDLQAEVTGLVFPVYCFGMPSIVTRFISRIATCRSRYVFGVSNCAGNPGFTLRQLQELLAARNIRLDAALNVIMPSNYLPFGGAWKPQRQHRAFAHAAEQLEKLAEKIHAGVELPVRTPRFPPEFVSRLLYRTFAPGLAAAAARFSVTDECTGCGLCAAVCPVSNIDATSGRPRWGRHCEQCFACIQWCPARAIRLKRVNPAREHYHHPDVEARDLF